MLTTTGATVDLSELSLDELEAELATQAAHLYAGTCRWLELVAELDKRRGWAEYGCGSCAEWIAWRCALTPQAAREHVRVARSLIELPETHAAFARGTLSYAKVRALTRVATPENEEELLDLARVHTAGQLERTVRAYRRVSTAEAREQLDDAHLSVFWNADGSLEIHGRLAPEDGALLLRALDSLRDSLWKDGRGSAEPRPARQASNAEALVAVAESALAHEGETRPGGERYQVVIHADGSALSEGGCEVDDAGAVSPETARRLACDASIVRDGRRSRTIPPAVRRALRRRDHGCCFPGCENRRFVDAHHIRHWAHGGETTLDNLVLLCRRHHRAVHEGGYRVDAEGRFFNRWGKEIAAVPPLPRGNVTDCCVDDATTIWAGTGERLDLATSVDAMLAIDGRAKSRSG